MKRPEAGGIARRPSSYGRAGAALLLWAAVGASMPPAVPDGPLTGAELSSWERPTSHSEILEFLDALDAASELVYVTDLGPTTEGRPNPAVFLGDPAGEAAADRSSDRPTILILASVHGNERSGAEASLQLVRELALGDARPLLERLNVIVVPNMNPDGGEANRRENADGYDLNRDWVLAETPEVGAVLERLVVPFVPDVFVDVHNGGAYPYHLNFQATLDPAADSALVALARGPVYDAVAAGLERVGMELHWYAGAEWDREARTWFWRTTEPWPRKQHSYGGLRDMLTLLYEVPREHPPEVGAAAAREGLLALLAFVAENADQVRGTVDGARRRTIEEPPAHVPLDLEAVARAERTSFAVVQDTAGRSVPARVVRGEDRTLHVPTRTRATPWGYVLAAESEAAVDLLRRHGFEVETLASALPVAGEAFRIEHLGRDARRYQNRWRTRIEVTPVPVETTVSAGSHLVRVGQPGGRLIPRLLEPDAVDSLARWNLFDPSLVPSEGGGVAVVPVLRVLEELQFDEAAEAVH